MPSSRMGFIPVAISLHLVLILTHAADENQRSGQSVRFSDLHWNVAVGNSAAGSCTTEDFSGHVINFLSLMEYISTNEGRGMPEAASIRTEVDSVVTLVLLPPEIISAYANGQEISIVSFKGV